MAACVCSVKPFAAVGPARRMQAARVQPAAPQQLQQQRLAVRAAAAAVDIDALTATALLEQQAAAPVADAAAVGRQRKMSRRFATEQTKVPAKEVALPPLDAIKLALDTASAKFTETVEVRLWG